MTRFVRILIAVAAVIALLVIVFLAYAHTVMQGERPEALEAWRDDAVEITSAEAGIVIEPVEGATGEGLVFIPGAKVDPYAYLYKLSGVAEASGLTVVITKPTLNLAFFDQRPLSTFTALAPGVDDWYVGGHSLGGVRACQIAADGAGGTSGEPVAGLVLFGSYCANDLSGSGLAVLSISGEHDGLSTPEKIAEAAHLLPSDAESVVLEGANHADFGDYGVQPGDGVSTRDDAEVRQEIAEAVARFVG
ncbi:alpha/beta hydrolase [Agromyces lapidis]|uniref:Alpha/beta hydrolase n=1 Tax=Agromyces lapidis TaxID=279574 RepID=A0ABV5SM17_9MICO|nr:alpha/beta hydrolase [Agromyces lapidis]